MKSENVSRKRKGKREYLKEDKTHEMIKELKKYFELKVEMSLIRHGKEQRMRNKK